MRPQYLFPIAFTILVLAIVAQACGSPVPEAPPLASTASAVPSSATTVPSPVPTTVPTPNSQVAASTPMPPIAIYQIDGPCNTPYLDEAPFVPTPDLPILLRPQGAPPSVAPYGFELPAFDGALMERVRTAVGSEVDHFAIVIKNLSDGSGITLEPDREFYAASLYKTWVMLEAFNQQQASLLDWAEQYVVSGYYTTWGLNPGELEECDVVALQSMLTRMMGSSDNVAAVLLLDRVGSGNINRALRSLGLARSGFDVPGTMPTTAAETALLLEAIYEGAAVNDAASEAMLALLKTELIDDRIPALLPPGTEVAHKTGNWEDATHDVGIVFSQQATYLIVVLTDYGYADGGGAAIAELSRAVYDYYNGGQPGSH